MINLFTCRNVGIKHSQFGDEYRSAGAAKARGLSPGSRAAWPGEAATSSGRI